MVSDAVEVFFSYSHKDEALRDQLATHLKLLERQGIIAAWHDRKIVPGAVWAEDIHHYLERADIILLLVSADFLASDYCWDIEIQQALDRHQAGTTTVIPVILRPVDWSSAPFARLQALPKNAQPVVTWTPPDLAFMDIAQGIRHKAEAILAARRDQAEQTRLEAALEQYQQKVQEYLADGELSLVEEDNLQDLAEALGIDPTRAAAIKTQELTRRQAYDTKLSRYRQTFIRALDHEFPLSLEIQAQLRERQQILGLAAADVQAVEATALAEKAAAAAQGKARNQDPPPTPPPAYPAPPPAPAPKPLAAPAGEGDFREPLGNQVELEMVKIPAGAFLMGSPDSEPGRDNDEGPQHRVTMPEFWMGKYPVTQAQWAQVAAWDKVKMDLNPDPAWFKGPRLPVEQVNWYEAVEFCQRLSQKTGRIYRLPSEAEWEYACRAGTTTRYYFGDAITGEQVNCDCRETVVVSEGILGIGRKEEKRGIYRQKTTEVGSFPPNAFGLYDMHGNVWEWCADHWHSSYEGAPADGSAWLSDNESASRLLRGGSWLSYPWYCRSANRNGLDPGNRYSSLGFRVVCAAARALG